MVLPKSVTVPAPRTGSASTKATAGSRLFFDVPQPRALLALDVAGATASAMVIVNTVVHVRDLLGRPEGSARSTPGP
ncbi:hypothetical protein [Streptomyces sp. NPDC093568]|uniref:hypothetical protein n=1 Tax=Streptomyces sp. NPDC093568 TaxID=3366041 RepID=UPI00381D0EDA